MEQFSLATSQCLLSVSTNEQYSLTIAQCVLHKYGQNCHQLGLDTIQPDHQSMFACINILSFCQWTIQLKHMTHSHKHRKNFHQSVTIQFDHQSMCTCKNTLRVSTKEHGHADTIETGLTETTNGCHTPLKK